ncbi:phosphonate ABC transporter, permease protein PhnE [Bacteriovorax sp. BSW11_IV]|uniref:phosphonate ABC transporter, permease protein PhnE n=1 Tax=Bacteriovorax sp. BSW11_IV TaxID=1353529 RepID=UPI00038A23A9|nr:phosphonate ABC transporter, permease protein PhnE [Bacteriovorax sp. BSW11_IV]EQC49377.1 phosphonate ABC transporter, permease protein PhnE [Bacteriovorax sp. BSW11_IV]
MDMSTTNENTTPDFLQDKGLTFKKVRANFWALFIDVFMWSYTILVSWKIIYEKIILGLRFPEFSWNQPLIALGAGAVVAIALHMTKLSIGRACMGLMKRDENKPIFREPFMAFGLVIIILTFIAGLFLSQVSIREFLSASGLIGAKRIFTALFNPNFNIIADATFAAVETIYMAFIATAFSLPFAFILAFFAARNLMSGSPLTMTIYSLVRFVLNVSRSIEPLVWAIIFSVWVGIGPFAGMLALMLHSVSSLSKLYSEQIENISEGPIEAMTATGAHPVQVIWYGVVPQIVLPYLSYTIYRWDINVRMATVIGLVGGGGIGTMLMQYQGLAKWNEVGLLVIVIAVIVWVMDYLSSQIREAIK